MVNDFDPMPAIFSSMYLLNPWISETTTTKAVTPMIMPKRVNAERSLCAQIAAIASLRVSTNFTVALLRSILFPTQCLNWIKSRCFPGGPQAENYTHCRGDADADPDCPQWYVSWKR